MLKSSSFALRRPATKRRGGAKLLQRHEAAVETVVAEAKALVLERERLLSEISDTKLRDSVKR
ncbi:hypothetical protein [Sphingobium boeckii]|uniref:Uncharacterized protein n=1 Tax=Sphingobium boeckii TaxID=1082345 RepID=A0A7W9ALE6_9SPHN|nr:hypothetical protein [Sphingobium boeckii]MBB5687839.1 hypothetical protein [Sphingobium boeckii]